MFITVQKDDFRVCVLNLACMTLTLTCDLDTETWPTYIVKMYLHIKNGVCRSRHSKVKRQNRTQRNSFAPVTLTLVRLPWHMILGLDDLKMYQDTKNKVSRMLRLSKVRVQTGQTDRHTNRCDWKYYHAAFPHGNNSHSSSSSNLFHTYLWARLWSSAHTFFCGRFWSVK